MVDYSDLKQKLLQAREDGTAKPKEARLGNPATSEIDVPIETSGQAGLSWIYGVLGEGTSAGWARNIAAIPKENRIVGAYILVKRVGRLYEIQGLAPQNDEYMHGVNPVTPDPVPMGRLNIGLLQPTDPRSMAAQVSEGIYHHDTDGTPYYVPALETQDFTSEIPANPGEAKAFCVQLDPATATLSYAEGSVFDAALSHANAFADYYPAPDSDKWCVGWVKLISGMTAIYEDIHILPGQRVLSKGGGSGVSDAADLSYTPTTSGDWDTPPDNGQDAYDELASRVSAVEGGGAPDNAGYVTTQANGTLSAEFNLGSLTTGLLKHAVAAGVSTPATAVAETDYVTPSGSGTLANKALTTPTIADLSNATHNHTNAAGGGQLTDAALSAAIGISKGGTGQTTQTAALDALSPTTTKGDLLMDNGTNVIRLAVGSNGQVLTADSGEAAGAKWATPSGGGEGASAPQFVQTATVTVGNTTTEGTLIGSGTGSATISADDLNTVGKTLRIRGTGRAQRTSGNVNIRVKIGGTTVFATGSVAMPIGTGADNPFSFQLELTTRTTGATGTLMGQGGLLFWASSVAVGGAPLPALTSPTVLDLTGALAFDFTVQWATAVSNNTMSLDTLVIEVLN